MLNQVIIVGRMTDSPIIKNEKTNITIAVPRAIKNANGEYDTDIIDIELFNSISENVSEYCKKGDLVGIKGKIARLSTDENLRIIAEKITFLSSKKG